ncbi:MAG: biotin/lipoyl-binding protein [Bacteroidota bacterium]
MKTLYRLSLVAISISTLISCKNTDKTGVLQGKVKRESISIAPKVPGRISNIRVNEGDIVNRGDTLAIIDVPEIEAKLQQAEGAVISANSQYDMAVNGATDEQIEQVNSMYKAAKEQYIYAQKSLNRVRIMYNDSLIAPQKFDESLAKYKGALAQYNAAKAKKKEVLKGTRNEKILMAHGVLQRAKGSLKEAKVAYSERYIISPKNMSVETIALREGELALPGYNLVIGYEENTAYFRFTIRESQLHQFKKNEVYVINLPFKNKDVKSKLVSVKQLANYADKTSSYPDYELGEAVYELKFEPENHIETKDLFNNYTAILNKKI